MMTWDNQGRRHHLLSFHLKRYEHLCNSSLPYHLLCLRKGGRERERGRRKAEPKPSMGISAFVSYLLLIFTLFHAPPVHGNAELRALMDTKASLDPANTFLTSWTVSGDPCDDSFEGVACNEKRQVANISLQGKGLSGTLSPAITGLKHLTGLYLHYNSLYGEITSDISNLTELSDLYLNVNNLSGNVPPELGNMASLQVLQLCYNQFTGSIPTQLGSLKKLSVLALQSNQLTGAIPASLGDLGLLVRLDLSFNHLFGSIPTSLAGAPLLEVLDVRNNTLSGNVPPALKRLVGGFQYGNNPRLCGVGFSSLRACSALDHLNPSRPEPYGDGTAGLSTKDIPESANLKLNCTQTRCSNSSKGPQASVVVGVIVVTLALSALGILIFAQYRKQKLGSSFDISDGRLSTDQAKEVYRKKGSPLVSLEYSNGWDPLADGRNFGGCPQEDLQNFRFNLEEVESATQYFAEKNLLGKSNFSAIYRGILRDGSVVAIKSISKTSCKSEEAEFLKGLNILTSLRHENLVGLRGFCCSRGRGIEYLHEGKVNKPALVHQNISAEKVLIDQQFKPLLSHSGLHKLLTNDIVFSALKASAAMGYLAPEYANTGRFTEQSDVYAFGVLVFQILSGKQKLTSSIRAAAESCKFHDFIDTSLHGSFSEYEAAKLAKVALMCTHESPEQRPSMQAIILELGNCTNYF